ncbi:MAG: hypothetical protein L3V56_05745 [Candidatus Magnetoovum sp. WYHC-5]|nr:hypothetical protein [Candidatus Magnetoovum sp. WYHC-5]
MSSITAIFIDTISIQRYVFESNKLIENVGASYIVQSIYGPLLRESFNTLYKTQCVEHIVNKWKEPNNDKAIGDGDEFGIGYIGGGNALLFFRQENTAKEFVETWTKLLLCNAPGVQTAIAKGLFKENTFKDSYKALHEELKVNKNKFHPITLPYKFGITADCPLSGHSSEVYYESNEEKKYISSYSFAKISYFFAKINSKNKANEYLEDLRKDEIGEKLDFTTNINQLGQTEGEDNYIAIVHIDGNKMGQKFKDCESLLKLRQLSINTLSATENAFKNLVKHIINLIENGVFKDVLILKQSEDNKTFLPLRPIIIGGDDITFVCDGRLGVYFAEKYIEILKSEEHGYNACAGICIVKTKHPFYRAYKLAEELCRNSKKQSRDNNDVSCLDFYITSGDITGSLEDIRKKQSLFTYNSTDNELTNGPYILEKEGTAHRKSIVNLKAGIKNLQQNYSATKIMELRNAIISGKEKTYIVVEYIKPKLEKIDGDYKPYFDMIELKDFYPEVLL